MPFRHAKWQTDLQIRAFSGGKIMWTYATWNETVENGNHLFDSLIQVFSEKAATTLKVTATVAYLVHMVLLDFTKEYHRFLIDYGHTLVGWLPVFASIWNEKENNNDTKDAVYQNEEE